MLALRKDETLVHLANRVVVATVVKVPVARALGRVVLEVEFQIERCLKGGRAGGLLKIPVPFHVSPAGILPSFNFPHFSPGERYAIFLSRRDVPLEFVHLRGMPTSQLTSLDVVTDLRPLLPPVRTGARDGAFGRVPTSVACATHPVAVHVRHEAHMVLDGAPDHLPSRALDEEVGAAAAIWNGIANVVVFAGPHGRFPVQFSRELPLHGSGLAATDWQLDRTGTIVDAQITMYLANEAGPIPWAPAPQPGHFDIRSTIAHEIGHVLGLRHSSTVGDLMEGSAARKGVRRTMTDNDRARLREIYPFGRGMSPEVIEQAGKSLVHLARQLRRAQQAAQGLASDGDGAGDRDDDADEREAHAADDAAPER